MFQKMYGEPRPVSTDNARTIGRLDEMSRKVNPQINADFHPDPVVMREGPYIRVAIISDTHCGHFLGLTHPNYQYSLKNEEMSQVAKIQREAWNWYVDAIKSIGPTVDVLVVNGDLIDGKGERSGSTELITPDRQLQVAMGIKTIEEWDAGKIFMTRGTPYHTGKDEQFEDVGAQLIGAHIDDTIDFKINGKVFNFRHKVGSTSVPYGKATSVSKEATMNKLTAVHNDTKGADIVVRSHVHYMVSLRESSKIAITTPALQVNSRYGRQQCTGITDFGFIIIDVYENGYVDVKPYIANLKFNKSTVFEI